MRTALWLGLGAEILCGLRLAQAAAGATDPGERFGLALMNWLAGGGAFLFAWLLLREDDD